MVQRMMICFSDYSYDHVLTGIAGIWILSFLVLFWIWHRHEFEGKRYFIISFVAILWWVFTLGVQIALSGLQCKSMWALFAWPAIAVLPITWSLYVEEFVSGRVLTKSPVFRLIVIGLPVAIGLGALTNSWHNLMIAEATVLSEDGTRAIYAYGPMFYVAASSLYPFVLRTIWLLSRATFTATGSARSLLIILIAITCGPLIANAAYVLGGVTVYGVDPTSLMFSVGLVAFGWMLVTDRMLDTKALGRDALFHASEDPVLVIDKDHRVISWNDATASRLFVSGEMQDSPIDRMPDPVSTFLFGLECSSPAVFGPQFSASGRVYEPRAIRVACPIDPARRHIGWSVTFFDITERVKFEESLKSALEDAEQAAKAKDNFLAVISHELRTPMTSLKGGLDLALSGRLGVMPAPLMNPLVIAQRNANRLSQLITDVLDVQKLELKEFEISPEQVDLSSILCNALEENHQMARKRQVELIRQDDRSICPIVVGDPFRLRQVIDNVISNAVKFSPDGGCSIETSLTVQNGWARISVRDHGLGIPSGQEEIVFGRFSQIDGSNTRSGEGTGLGMYISRQIMAQMDGRLFYENAATQGTIFHIELPCRVVESLEEVKSGHFVGSKASRFR